MYILGFTLGVYLGGFLYLLVLLMCNSGRIPRNESIAIVFRGLHLSLHLVILDTTSHKVWSIAYFVIFSERMYVLVLQKGEECGGAGEPLEVTSQPHGANLDSARAFVH